MDKVIEFVKNIIRKKDNIEVSCDMTCGRGNDTLFLSGLSKKVYAFDIQKDAIESTKEKTKECNNVALINDSHSNVDKYVFEGIDVAMYNLGYLPKGDHHVTTNYLSTIDSIKKTTLKLNVKGIITIIIYPGHPEGYEESVKITEYLKTFNQKEYEVLKYEFINQINMPPYAYVIEKLK